MRRTGEKTTVSTEKQSKGERSCERCDNDVSKKKKVFAHTMMVHVVFSAFFVVKGEKKRELALMICCATQVQSEVPNQNTRCGLC